MAAVLRRRIQLQHPRAKPQNRRNNEVLVHLAHELVFGVGVATAFIIKNRRPKESAITYLRVSVRPDASLLMHPDALTR